MISKKVISCSLIGSFYVLLLFIMICPLYAGQILGREIKIVGEVKGLESTSLNLAPFYGKSRPVSKIEVASGHFSYSATLEPGRYVLTSNDYSFKIEFFIDQNDVLIKGDKSNIVSVKSGKTQVEYLAYQKQFAGIDLQTKKQDELYKKARINGDQVELKAINQQLDSLSLVKKDIAFGYVESHPSSYLALDQMYYLLRLRYPSVQRLEDVYKHFNPSLKETTIGKELTEGFQSYHPVFVPFQAEPFSLPDTEGHLVNLADYKGKYVLVDFWASWCVPCRAENPNVLKVYNEFHDKGLQVLGVSMDNKKEAWLKAIADDKLPWTHVSSLEGMNDAVYKSYKLNGIPDNFLIDPSGKVIARGLRGESLELKMKEVFNK